MRTLDHFPARLETYFLRILSWLQAARHERIECQFILSSWTRLIQIARLCCCLNSCKLWLLSWAVITSSISRWLNCQQNCLNTTYLWACSSDLGIKAMTFSDPSAVHCLHLMCSTDGKVYVNQYCCCRYKQRKCEMWEKSYVEIEIAKARFFYSRECSQ